MISVQLNWNLYFSILCLGNPTALARQIFCYWHWSVSRTTLSNQQPHTLSVSTCVEQSQTLADDIEMKMAGKHVIPDYSVIMVKLMMDCVYCLVLGIMSTLMICLFSEADGHLMITNDHLIFWGVWQRVLYGDFMFFLLQLQDHCNYFFWLFWGIVNFFKHILAQCIFSIKFHPLLNIKWSDFLLHPVHHVRRLATAQYKLWQMKQRIQVAWVVHKYFYDLFRWNLISLYESRFIGLLQPKPTN